MSKLMLERGLTDFENAERHMPKEVPARLKGRRVHFEKEWGEVTLELWTNGDRCLWQCSYDREFYHPQGVVALFTGLEVVGGA